jgi:hypothetical protein
MHCLRDANYDDDPLVVPHIFAVEHPASHHLRRTSSLVIDLCAWKCFHQARYKQNNSTSEKTVRVILSGSGSP